MSRELDTWATAEALLEPDPFDVLLDVAVVAISASTPARTPEWIREFLVATVAEKLATRNRSYLRGLLMQQAVGL